MPSEDTASEERFKLVVEYSPIAMLLVNDAGSIEMVNIAAETLFGYTNTELVGQSVDILIPEALLVHHHGHRADFAAAPRPRAMDVGRDLYALHKNGSRFPVEIGLNPIETQDGIVVLASITDLSARSKTEQMWRHFASIIESSEDAIVSKTMDGIIASWNPAAERIFGYSESEAIGKPITMLFPPDRLAEEADLMERLARGERIARYDTARVRKDGCLVDVSVKLSPIMDGFGNVVGASKIVHDIAERKRTEKDLRERTAVLRAFADRTPAAVAMFDREMRYVVASRQWLEERGLADRNIVGLSHYDLFPNFPEHHKEVHRRCLAGAIERSEEDFLPSEDGAERWIRWEVRPWSYPDGELGGILVWTQDITASKAINDEVRRMAVTDPLTSLPNRRLLMDRLTLRCFQASAPANKVRSCLWTLTTSSV
jgi:PAS domain S-box-containing protein